MLKSCLVLIFTFVLNLYVNLKNNLSNYTFFM